IGLNTGPAKVGNFGSATSKNYTMIGDTVNLAARLEGANKVYHTFLMVAAPTFEAARAAIEARELDRLRVKGKSEPVTVYEPLGPRGTLAPARHELVRRFHEALTLYRERRFDESLAAFELLAGLDPADGPTRTYLERCRSSRFRASVGPGWDGVYEMTEK
ncbi:MAG: adenylate/guanylate cyclase domain-containing protein, partial [Candidatus Riflebacteria bacterium]|nr:adenylate/guanylate cyclase domain-containing protein [Candidatus Riflebacteria bacterium]